MNIKFSKVISFVTSFVVTLFLLSGDLQIFVNEFDSNAVEDKIAYGDVNSDDRVDVFDLCLMKQELSEKGSTSINLIAADVTGDSIFDVEDARELQQFLLCQRDSFSVSEHKATVTGDTTIVSGNQPIETSLTVEIASLADELGNDIAVYNYLYNNMRTEFYYGSRKGAIGAFEQGGGNDTDLSSLLIAMLRYLGYEANYATSNVSFTEEQLLKWTNTNDIDVAKSIYSQQGRLHKTHNVDGKTYYSCEYKCVQLKKNDKIYYLDVCFKEYGNQGTIYDKIDSDYSFNNIDSIINNCDLNLLESEIAKSETAIKSFNGKNYALNSKKIIQKNIKEFSSNPSYIFDEEPIISESITDDESDYVVMSFGSGKKYTFRTPELYKKNITIEYEVSSDSKELGDWFDDVDASNIFGLIATKVGGSSCSVIPVVKFDGEKIFTGPSLRIVDKQKFYITAQTGGKSTEYVEELTAGEMCSLIFDTGQISSNELAEAYNKALSNTSKINASNGLTADMSNNNLNEFNVYSSDYFGSLLRFAGVMYFSQLDISSHSIAERNDIDCENILRFGIVGFQPDVYTGNTLSQQKGGIQKEGKIFVDILSNTVNPISKNADKTKVRAFNFDRGLVSSELESAVIEEVFNVGSLSTVSLFRYAQENNIELVTLYSDSEKKVSDLNISSQDAKIIQEEIDNGKIIITTQSSVKIGSWSGIGYIAMSANGTSQEYILSGGLKGGVVFDPIGLCYAVNVALDLAFIAESVAIFMGILAAMSSLALVPIVGLAIAAVSIEFLAADILEQSLLYYDYEFKNNEEAGMKIWATTAAMSTITIATMAVGKGVSVFCNHVSGSRLASKYGKFVVENIKDSGFTASEINSKVKTFKKLGMTQSTVDELLKNPKSMFLGDDILALIGKQGGNQRLLAELVINNGDDFSKALMETDVIDKFCNIVWKYGSESAKSFSSAYYSNGIKGVDNLLKFIDKYGETANQDFLSTTLQGADFGKALKTYEALDDIAVKYSEDAMHYDFVEGEYRPNYKLSEIDRIDELGGQMYEEFRKTNDSIVKIANNTGWSIEDVTTIKNHVFNDIVLKDDGIYATLDSYYEQALAWQRLIDGNYFRSDVLLLEHELFEATYYNHFHPINNCTLRNAHEFTTNYYDWDGLITEILEKYLS